MFSIALLSEAQLSTYRRQGLKDLMFLKMPKGDKWWPSIHKSTQDFKAIMTLIISEAWAQEDQDQAWDRESRRARTEDRWIRDLFKLCKQMWMKETDKRIIRIHRNRRHIKGSRPILSRITSAKSSAACRIERRIPDSSLFSIKDPANILWTNITLPWILWETMGVWTWTRMVWMSLIWSLWSSLIMAKTSLASWPDKAMMITQYQHMALKWQEAPETINLENLWWLVDQLQVNLSRKLRQHLFPNLKLPRFRSWETGTSSRRSQKLLNKSPICSDKFKRKDRFSCLLNRSKIRTRIWCLKRTKILPKIMLE